MAEPQDSIVAFLRDKLTDYNSADRIGSNWIYPDFPHEKLSKDSYPRVSVVKEHESARNLGVADDFWHEVRYSIYIFARDDKVLEDNGNKMKGFEVVEKIARDIIYAFRNYWKTDSNLENYYNFELEDSIVPTLDEGRNAWVKLITIKFDGVNY